jgi:hypothetical protein
MSGRNIPADIKRQVLIEAGHMCAIPVCRYPATQFAHIEPYSKVKEHKVENIIALCPNHHDQYDNKKSIDRKSLLIYKQKLQLLNSRYTKYEMRVLANLAQQPVLTVDSELMVQALLLDGLIKNIKSGLISHPQITDSKGNVIYKTTSVQRFVAALTDKGKEFVKNWESSSDSLEPLI